MKYMVKKQITIDQLGVMIQKGFQDIDEKVDTHEMQEQLGRIERLVLVDHKHRIEHLEFEVKNLKDLFALK